MILVEFRKIIEKVAIGIEDIGAEDEVYSRILVVTHFARTIGLLDNVYCRTLVVTNFARTMGPEDNVYSRILMIVHLQVLLATSGY